MPSSTRKRTAPKVKATGLRSNTPEFKVSTKKGRRAMVDKAKQQKTNPFPGLSGDALAKAKAGTPLRQQVEQARSAREYAELMSSSTNRKEATMASSTKQSRKSTRSDKETTVKQQSRKHTSSRTARQPSGITPAVIAKRAKVTPLEVRKALRAQKRITRKPEGWLLTEKQADAIVKALKA